ncbi:hypothetical protein [Streptomonospora salina]|uniref:Uncharacterized protein n=1 Tax=Streptomonospora salina TaxID=104205 RepID=A0A841E868_9ACTN|nr:hypothetical protein [Streptomonospora salina]MBB5999092.1 hypothetical protein [Streptomonospora salina]
MSSGKRLPPARFPLPLRLAVAVPVGSLFVGLPAPAAAVPDPAAPVLSFADTETTIEPGGTAETVLNIEPGDAEGTVCLYGLELSHGMFKDSGLDGPSPGIAVSISGRPEETAEVDAWLSYAELDGEDGAEADCPESPKELGEVYKAGTHDAFRVTVAAPEPTPEPSETSGPSESPSPTDSPGPSDSPDPTASPSPTDSPGPSDSPDPTASPSPTGSPTESVGPSPSPSGGPSTTASATDPDPSEPDPTDTEPSDPDPTDPDPSDPDPTDTEPSDPDPTDPDPTDTAPQDEETPDGDDATAPPHSPVTTGGRDAPGTGDLADLPRVSEGGDESDARAPAPAASDGDGMAELPSLEPGEDDASRTTGVAASENTPAPVVTPAVLVLFLVLLLLFSMPLAPSRRVRIGPTAYMGRRRKG